MYACTRACTARPYARTDALPSARPRPPARPVPPALSPVTQSRGGGRRAGVIVGEEVARVSGRERRDVDGQSRWTCRRVRRWVARERGQATKGEERVMRQ